MESRPTLSEIPGLFSSDPQQEQNMSAPFEGMENTQTSSESDRIFLLSGRSLLEVLLNEKERLDPSLVHSNRLLDKEIASVQSGGDNSRVKQQEKIFIPLEEQKKYNVIGRLLGPKGLTLKRMQSETQTKMSILGRGSMKDRKKEEELRNSDIPAHAHLKEDLHVLVDAEPPFSTHKLAAGVSEVKKMLIPLEPGQPDMIAAKYHDQLPVGLEGYSSTGKLGLPGPSGPRSQLGMRSGDRSSPHRGGSRGRGGGSGLRGRGRGRGGHMRDPDGGRGPERPMRSGWGSNEGNGERARGSILEGAGGFGYGAGKKNIMRREEQSSRTDSRPFGGPSVGPAPDRDLGGYNGRRSSFGQEASYGRPERFNDDADPYYNSFSEAPHSPVSRDYHHGSGSSEWKATRPSRREYRHHPYQQPSGSYY